MESKYKEGDKVSITFEPMRIHYDGIYRVNRVVLHKGEYLYGLDGVGYLIREKNIKKEG